MDFPADMPVYMWFNERYMADFLEKHLLKPGHLFSRLKCLYYMTSASVAYLFHANIISRISEFDECKTNLKESVKFNRDVSFEHWTMLSTE